MATWGPASEVEGLFCKAEDEPPPLPRDLSLSFPPKSEPRSIHPKRLQCTPLSAMQVRILKFLAEKQDWATRKEIGAKTGDKKGFSGALGAPTNPPLKPDSLEGRGFVERRGTTSSFQYRITSSGRRALSGDAVVNTVGETTVTTPSVTPTQDAPQALPPASQSATGSTTRKLAKDFAHLRLAGYRNINELTRVEHQLHGCETLFGDFSARVMVLLQDFANVPIVQARTEQGERNPFHHSVEAQTNVNLVRLFTPYFDVNIHGGECARTCGLYYANAVWLLKEDPKGLGKSASLPRLRQVLQECEPVFRATLQNLPDLELIIAFGSVAFQALQMYLNIHGDWLGMVTSRRVLSVGRYLVGATTHSTARGVMRRKQMSPNEVDPMAGDIRAFLEAIGIRPR